MLPIRYIFISLTPKIQAKFFHFQKIQGTLQIYVLRLCAMLKSNIKIRNFGIGVQKQFRTSCRVEKIFLLKNHSTLLAPRNMTIFLPNSFGGIQ